MHKLAQILLPGLAAVCMDGTTGDPFCSPSAVAVDLRKETSRRRTRTRPGPRCPPHTMHPLAAAVNASAPHPPTYLTVAHPS
ncbi:hypothetical protein Zm00014a_018133 [Zea mays]|uniref:Secreted protein n=1 Tax=Zea mays TaxID=4577 RepID=A0A3L6ECC6_MAIZE|nr:hypothetical protein Zm00014a_018133 [Zea mays]